MIASEPLIWYETELPLDKTIVGVKMEIDSVKDFDVYDEELATNLTPEQLKACVPIALKDLR